MVMVSRTRTIFDLIWATTVPCASSSSKVSRTRTALPSTWKALAPSESSIQ